MALGTVDYVKHLPSLLLDADFDLQLRHELGRENDVLVILLLKAVLVVCELIAAWR